jgi:hypothetical protein
MCLDYLDGGGGAHLYCALTLSQSPNAHGTSPQVLRPERNPGPVSPLSLTKTHGSRGRDRSPESPPDMGPMAFEC